MADQQGADQPNMVKRAQPAKLEQNAGSNIKQVIGIMSGKGGVGKSLVCGLLAVEARRKGLKVGILDADITGPSIPHMFGIDTQRITMIGKLLAPAITSTGIKVMSINLMMNNPNDPVIWRGSMIAGCVSQFWTDVAWGDIDVLFVDMPPGTGDVPLTVFQSLPIEGVVIVTSPQDLVSMIVNKAVKMAKEMDVPVLGVVENMSYLKCPHCGERVDIFGKSQIHDIAKEQGLQVLAQLPIDATMAAQIDRGRVEDVEEGLIDAEKVVQDAATVRVKDALIGSGFTFTTDPSQA
ncbi:Mrp/NBP35 family ATP-binding protein [bacterium]|nr:Mrp/NBP35 family ATP-binding protein [bacterium]